MVPQEGSGAGLPGCSPASNACPRTSASKAPPETRAALTGEGSLLPMKVPALHPPH